MSEITERLREVAGFLRGLAEGRGGDLRPRAKRQGREYAADLEMIAAFYDEADARAGGVPPLDHGTFAPPVQSANPPRSNDPPPVSNDPLPSSP